MTNWNGNMTNRMECDKMDHHNFEYLKEWMNIVNDDARKLEAKRERNW